MATVYVRDKILIDDQFRTRLAALLGQGRITIVAREIVHAPGYIIEFPGADLTFIASEYNANGGAISVDGLPGGAGGAGEVGSIGTAFNGEGTPGGPGGNGVDGLPGTSAGSVRLICQHLTNARLHANGGEGGAGGPGGTGGHGGNGRIVRRPSDPFTIEGTDGGPGGAGGKGGDGGRGGTATVAYVAADTSPIVQAISGAGGKGGKGGVKGAFAENNGAAGDWGLGGTDGAGGQAQATPIGGSVFWEQALSTLGDDAMRWADYRLAAGEYYYRAYNPTPGGVRATYLQTAMGEFEAVLVINPTNAKAQRLQTQVLLNQNILGLPHDLDVTPDFPTYESSFLQWGNLIGGVYLQGINTMLANVSLDVAAMQLTNNIANIQRSLDALKKERDIAKLGQDIAGKEVDHADAHVTEVQQQLQAAIAEMNQHSFDLLGLVTTVGEVAGAVVGVIGAAITGGASLVALAPALAALTTDVVATLPSITGPLMKPTDAELDKVKQDYAAAKQDFDKVVAAGKAIYSLVTTIQKLEAGTTPDNSKYVALVKQGVEAAHIQLLAHLRKKQSDLTLQAAESRLAAAQQSLQEAQNQLAVLKAETTLLKAVALNLIQAARLNIDVLLTDLFKAERSVEIYCLQDQSNRVFFDIGYVNPDVEQDYREGYDLLGTGLVQALSGSWSQALTPSGLRATYEVYFAQANLVTNILPLAFTDADALAKFQQTKTLAFQVELSDLPNNIFEAKTQAVYISLVGASSPAGIASCTVMHSSLYRQKRRPNAANPPTNVDTQPLQAHSAIEIAPYTPLQPGGVQLTPGNPLTTPQVLSFWGRGVAGGWSLTLEAQDNNRNVVNLSTLSQIQVWIVYQAFLI